MEYVITNKYGRVIAIRPSLYRIAEETGTTVYGVTAAMQRMKPIRDKFMVIPLSKHEYLWHKHGGKNGGDDFFAFCTKEELQNYKQNQRAFL